MRYTHVLLTVVIGSFSLGPIVAFASSWDRLNDDLDAMQRSTAIDGAAEESLSSEAAWQLDTELFPIREDEADKSVVEEKRDERTKSFLTVEVGKQVLVFSDVPRTSWQAVYIRPVVEQGYLSGYRDSAGILTGKFGPNDPVTVEQMAKVLVIAARIDTAACPPKPLNITASGSWSVGYISCAERAGWSIYGDGSVDVHRSATRSEVVVSVLQAFSVTLGSSGSGAIFGDVSATMQFAPYIAQAKQDLLISGYSDEAGEPTGMFGPADPVTRAEFAKILTVALQVYPK